MIHIPFILTEAIDKDQPIFKNDTYPSYLITIPSFMKKIKLCTKLNEI